jgi:hypothetical protein
MARSSFLSALALVLFSPAVLAQSDNCAEITPRAGFNTVAMQAGGRPTAAVLNTGILPIGISKSLAQSLGGNIEPVPSRNRVWSAIPAIVGQVGDVPITLFEQDLEIDRMYVLDNPGEFVYLSLLMFDSFVIQMNLAQSKLCFMKRSAVNLKESANLKMKMLQGRMAIQVAINKREPVWLDVQLEYPGALRLTRDAAIELGLTSEDSSATSSTVDTLMFGPYELGNINVAFPGALTAGGDQAAQQRMGRRSGGQQASGAVGYEVLKHFVTTFDLETERMNVYVP